MPYTFSHASIFLPFRRFKNFPILFAMLGSLIPDFGYYFFLPHSFNVLMHDALWGIVFGLPLSYVLCIALKVLRQPFFQVFELKSWVDRRNVKNNFTWCLVALILGIESHVIWDAFSHKPGWGVMHFPFFENEFFLLPLYKINQYFSSLLGLLFLFFYFRPTFTQTALAKKTHFYLLWLGLFFFVLHLPFLEFIKGQREIFVTLVLALTRSFLVGLFLILVFQKNKMQN